MKYVIIMIMATVVISCAATKKSQSIEQLAGKWELSSAYKDSFNAPKNPAIEFDIKQGKVFGNNGCNSFNGSYTSEKAGMLNISKSLLMTRMMCVGYAENTLTNKLYQTKQYVIKHNVLQFKDGNTVLLEWVRP